MSKTVRNKGRKLPLALSTATVVDDSLAPIKKRQLRPRKKQRVNSRLIDLDAYLVRSGFDPKELKNESKDAPPSVDSTYGGARDIGDSSRLGRARYDLKGKAGKGGLTFGEWKRGREAQHLIPASLYKNKFSSFKNMVDTPRNGMLLPNNASFDDPQNPNNSPVFRNLGKRNKPVHRQPKYRNHSTYTSNVESFINDVTRLPGESIKKNTLHKVMDSLREAHKTIGQKQTNTNTKKFVDNISTKRMKKAWNSVHKTNDF